MPGTRACGAGWGLRPGRGRDPLRARRKQDVATSRTSECPSADSPENASPQQQGLGAARAAGHRARHTNPCLDMSLGRRDLRGPGGGVMPEAAADQPGACKHCTRRELDERVCPDVLATSRAEPAWNGACLAGRRPSGSVGSLHGPAWLCARRPRPSATLGQPQRPRLARAADRSGGRGTWEAVAWPPLACALNEDVAVTSASCTGQQTVV